MTSQLYLSPDKALFQLFLFLVHELIKVYAPCSVYNSPPTLPTFMTVSTLQSSGEGFLQNGSRSELLGLVPHEQFRSHLSNGSPAGSQQSYMWLSCFPAAFTPVAFPLIAPPCLSYYTGFTKWWFSEFITPFTFISWHSSGKKSFPFLFLCLSHHCF